MDVSKGPVGWLPKPKLPPDSPFQLPDLPPNLDFSDAEGGGIDISAGWGPVGISVTASVADGKLKVETDNPFIPKADLDKWVKDLNDSLEANGKQFSELDIRDGKLHFEKQDIPPSDDETEETEPASGETPPSDSTGDAADSGGPGWKVTTAITIGVAVVGFITWLAFSGDGDGATTTTAEPGTAGGATTTTAEPGTPGGATTTTIVVTTTMPPPPPTTEPIDDETSYNFMEGTIGGGQRWTCDGSSLGSVNLPDVPALFVWHEQPDPDPDAAVPVFIFIFGGGPGATAEYFYFDPDQLGFTADGNPPPCGDFGARDVDIIQRYDASDGSVFIAGSATPPTPLSSFGASLYFDDPNDPNAFISQSGFALGELTVRDRASIRAELAAAETFGFSDFDGTDDEVLGFLDTPFP